MSKGKHELDALAAKLAMRNANNLIVTPDAANETSQQAYQGEYQNIWNLRDQFLTAALDGGLIETLAAAGAVTDAEVTERAMNLAESLAKESCRRRALESLKIARMTRGKAGPAFRFLAESLGIDVDAEMGTLKAVE